MFNACFCKSAFVLPAEIMRTQLSESENHLVHRFRKLQLYALKVKQTALSSLKVEILSLSSSDTYYEKPSYWP